MENGVFTIKNKVLAESGSEAPIVIMFLILKLNLPLIMVMQIMMLSLLSLR